MRKQQTLEKGNTVLIQDASSPFNGLAGIITALGANIDDRNVSVQICGAQYIFLEENVEKITGTVKYKDFVAALEILSGRGRFTTNGHQYIPEIQILVDANWAYDPDPFYMMSDQFLSRSVALTDVAREDAIALGYKCRCCERFHNPKVDKGFCSSCHSSGTHFSFVKGADGKIRCGAHHLSVYPEASEARDVAHKANNARYPRQKRGAVNYADKFAHERERKRINAEVYGAGAEVVKFEEIA